MLPDSRFNEAAGIPRGRLNPGTTNAPSGTGFNEAAGIPRGRPEQPEQVGLVVVPASMRPRVFPAEDLTEFGYNRPSTERASMRPRVFPAEDL